MSTSDQSKTKCIRVRASSSVKLLLQEAARAHHKTVSEFLLDAGVVAARQVLVERQCFMQAETHWQAFQVALDAPTQAKPCLKRLLTDPGVLD